MKILLVEPNFPVPPKSKNYKNFLPIGLLKIASYLKAKGNKVQLIRGELKIEDFDFEPDEIWITSLFTYWSRYVKNSVEYYKRIFPKTKIIVGGIYASLMPDHCKKYTGCDEVFCGVYEETENYFPSYELLNSSNPHPLDYQILHASRGCIRHCKFCGAWQIEPTFKPEKSIKDKIKYSKIVFYDNNILANPHIENILSEIIELKKRKKILWCEAQSGFDGRILKKKPYLGKMLKEARFRYPRIAWDWGYSEHREIKKQIDILVDGGYNSKDIYIFMLYNWDLTFEKMERKRIKCWDWQVQISDCRYRPLDQTYDNYDFRKSGQTEEEYHIHKETGWTDVLVKQFRNNVRRQNICVRYGFPFYSKDFEQKRFSKKIMRKTKQLKTMKEKEKFLKEKQIKYWVPDKITYPTYGKN